jgi:nucleoside-diphosphate-sugar epimerase
VLGWEHKVEFEDGVRKVVEWYGKKVKS